MYFKVIFLVFQQQFEKRLLVLLKPQELSIFILRYLCMTTFHATRKRILVHVKRECLKFVSALNETLLADVSSGSLISLYTDGFPNM